MKISGFAIVTIMVLGVCHAQQVPSPQGYEYAGSITGKHGRSSTTSVYYISNTPSNWGDARFSCEQAFNGHLVSIEDAVENKFIRDLMLKHSIGSVWTSGAYDAGSISWVWTSSFEKMVYTQWRTAPTTSNLYRVAVINDLFNSYWMPLLATSAAYSVCEVRQV